MKHFDEIPEVDKRSLATFGYKDYAISRDGAVWSYRRKKWRALAVDKRGYLRLTIVHDVTKKITTNLAHRLVAMAFLPNPDNKPQVNHKDGDKKNNHSSNLEWSTNLENAKHARENGLMPHNKLTEDDVHAICEYISEGMKLKTLSDKFGYPYHSIKAIRLRRNWTHISKDYVFPDFKNRRRLSGAQIEGVVKMAKLGIESGIIAKTYKVERTLIQQIRARHGCKHIPKSKKVG